MESLSFWKAISVSSVILAQLNKGAAGAIVLDKPPTSSFTTQATSIESSLSVAPSQSFATLSLVGYGPVSSSVDLGSTLVDGVLTGAPTVTSSVTDVLPSKTESTSVSTDTNLLPSTTITKTLSTACSTTSVTYTLGTSIITAQLPCNVTAPSILNATVFPSVSFLFTTTTTTITDEPDDDTATTVDGLINPGTSTTSSSVAESTTQVVSTVEGLSSVSSSTAVANATLSTTSNAEASVEPTTTSTTSIFSTVTSTRYRTVTMVFSNSSSVNSFTAVNATLTSGGLNQTATTTSASISSIELSSFTAQLTAPRNSSALITSSAGHASTTTARSTVCFDSPGQTWTACSGVSANRTADPRNHPMETVFDGGSSPNHKAAPQVLAGILAVVAPILLLA